MRELIRAVHMRYFDELKGIAERVDHIRETGDAADATLDEIDRRIRAFSDTLFESGRQLIREAS